MSEHEPTGAGRRLLGSLDVGAKPHLRPVGTGVANPPARERWRLIFSGLGGMAETPSGPVMVEDWRDDLRDWEKPMVAAIKRLADLNPTDPEFASVSANVEWAMTLGAYNIANPDWIDAEIDYALLHGDRLSLSLIVTRLEGRMRWLRGGS
jgi:hypothetical protein